jgi:tight adherence protein C
MTIAAILALLTFLSVSIGLMSVYLWAEDRLRRALIAKRLYGGAKQPPGQHKEAFEAAWQRLVHQAGVMVMPKTDEELVDIRTLLAWAGFRSEKAVMFYFGTKLCLAVTLGLLYLILAAAGSHLTAKGIIFSFFPLALGYYLPGVVLKARGSRRQQAIFRELPDALDLLLICIEAGLSFDMALHRISRELADIAPVLSAEFGQYFLEIQSGLPRKRVLRSLAERNGTPSLTAVINVLLQSIRFGTDVADALRVHIQSMRTERRQSAEEKGAKISTQLTFPLIMLILPALLIIILGPAVINIMERLQGGL